MVKERIVIFGRGKYYQWKKKSLERNYEIIGFLDNAVDESKDVFEGLFVVKNPTKWREFGDDVKIILMSVDWFAMYHQLCSLGVREDRVMLGVMESPYFNMIENFLQRYKIKIQTMSKARIIIRTEHAVEYYPNNKEELQSIYRRLYLENDELIGCIQRMSFEPSSRNFGKDRGKSIDRVYIETFLAEHCDRVHGVCMELGDDTYIRKFGHDVENTIVFHVYGEGKHAIKGNFETGEGLKRGSLDCLICTQTLQAIYDLKSSVNNIYNALKPNGAVLITVSGAGGSPVSISDYQSWGVYWRFTDLSLRKVLEEEFDKDKIEIKSYGNVKTQMAFQYGMCVEELQPEDFEPYDAKYPMIIGAVATK